MKEGQFSPSEVDLRVHNQIKYLDGAQVIDCIGYAPPPPGNTALPLAARIGLAEMQHRKLLGGSHPSTLRLPLVAAAPTAVRWLGYRRSRRTQPPGLEL